MAEALGTDCARVSIGELLHSEVTGSGQDDQEKTEILKQEVTAEYKEQQQRELSTSREKETEIIFEDQRRTNQIRVNLLVDMGVGIGGDKWPAADMFCRTLCDHMSFFESLFEGKSCIELGAGTGMVSMVIEKLYPGHSGPIVVTDHESHIGLISRNLRINNSKR